MIENTDIRAIQFISKNKSFIPTLGYMEDLKKTNKENIDIGIYNQIINEIKDLTIKFQITSQEQKHIQSLEKGKILKYILYRYVFKEYPRKKISTKFPIYILIEPVSSCNLKCGMCFQSDATFIKKEFMGKMDINLYKKLIDEAAANGTCAITFGSRGEPTIHPQIIEIIDYTKGKFLDVKLITNATKLSDELIHKIFTCNINQVSFSIDSEDKKIYEEIRKFSNFDLVLKNVKRYNEIKKSYKSINTTTRISGVQVSNKQDPKKFHEFWSKYSDEVVFKKAFERWNTYENEPHEDLNTPCILPWERMYIWYDGKVNPCDADYKSKLSYGNANENSIKEIWNSKKFNTFKEKHLKNRRNELVPCDRCGQS